MLAPQQILQSLQPATAVSHGKRALSQWDFSPWRSQLSLRRYSFSGVFEERPPRSTIVGNIRNSTFPERRKDEDHEPGDHFETRYGRTPCAQCHHGCSRNSYTCLPDQAIE